MKGILDKYQLNPTNCVFLDDIEDNTIAAETLDVKSYDTVDVLKKLNKQKTLYHLGGRGFLLIETYLIFLNRLIILFLYVQKILCYT